MILPDNGFSSENSTPEADEIFLTELGLAFNTIFEGSGHGFIPITFRVDRGRNKERDRRFVLTIQGIPDKRFFLSEIRFRYLIDRLLENKEQ